MSTVDTAEAVEAMVKELHFTVADLPTEIGCMAAAAMLRRLLDRAEAAEANAAELQRTFDLRWKADMRGIKRWQEATGRTLTWPDRADAVVFLLEKLDAAEAAHPAAVLSLLDDVERLRSCLETLNQMGGLGHDVHARIDAALEPRA